MLTVEIRNNGVIVGKLKIRQERPGSEPDTIDYSIEAGVETLATWDMSSRALLSVPKDATATDIVAVACYTVGNGTFQHGEDGSGHMAWGFARAWKALRGKAQHPERDHRPAIRGEQPE